MACCNAGFDCPNTATILYFVQQGRHYSKETQHPHCELLSEICHPSVLRLTTRRRRTRNCERCVARMCRTYAKQSPSPRTGRSIRECAPTSPSRVAATDPRHEARDGTASVHPARDVAAAPAAERRRGVCLESSRRHAGRSAARRGIGLKRHARLVGPMPTVEADEDLRPGVAPCMHSGRNTK